LKKIYFDTNIYSMIGQRGDAIEIRRYLKAIGHRVVASTFNLIEVGLIPSAAVMGRDLDAIRAVATDYEKFPLPYRHAREVFNEVRRVRPDWLRTSAPQSKIRAFLRQHGAEWKAIRNGSSPPKAWSNSYRAAAEPGNATSRETQKTMRSKQLEPQGKMWLVAGSGDQVVARMEMNLHDPEIAWRTECCTSWFNAIVVKHPTSRDYADYLGPHLKPQAFVDSAMTTDFWMRQVEGKNLPLNRTAGLSNYFQLRHKISHGNAVDALHACYLHDVDIFVTADKPFAAVLHEVAKLIVRPARVLLINRAATSTLSELRRIDDI
jgi:hypothetical protein